MILCRYSTYTSHLYPDAVVVGEAALQVGGQLARVDVLGQALQGGQVCLGRFIDLQICRDFLNVFHSKLQS